MSGCHKEERTSELVLSFSFALESCQVNICIHFWPLKSNKNVNTLEKGQQAALGVIRDLQHTAFKGALKEMELVLLKSRKIKKKDVIAEI